MGYSQVAILLCIILVALAIVWATYRYYKFYKEEHLTCPKCGYEFKPPVLKLVFSVNYIGGKYIKCPRCDSKEYCEAVKDKK